MPYATRSLLALALLGLLGSPGRAHYTMLLPRSASVDQGQATVLIYQWGHPFEHQLFDARAPGKLFVIAPDGKKTDLVKTLEKITVSAGGNKKVKAYRLRFTPRQRGDFLFVLQAVPIFMKEEKVFFQDTVKVVLHVEDQEGWDTSAGQALELTPLTRPYGLQPGMVFQAQALAAGKPVAGALIEIEPYHASPPRELPAAEQMTRTAKTDPNGVVTCTLTEAGWWCLTTQRAGGQREHQGKAYPVKERSTLWVFVDVKK